MLGYKIYFNGDKFVADNTATEVDMRFNCFMDG